MKTLQDVLSFAISSADAAIDQAEEYGGIENSIDSYRDNIRDTLKEYDLSEFEDQAWREYDAKVIELRAKRNV